MKISLQKRELSPYFNLFSQMSNCIGKLRLLATNLGGLMDDGFMDE